MVASVSTFIRATLNKTILFLNNACHFDALLQFITIRQGGLQLTIESAESIKLKK
jgi:hypothetical protein